MYVSYNSILEPLVESQVLAYLRELNRVHGFRFRLLSFEPAAMSRRLRQRIQARLRQSGIEWTYLRYHKRPSLLVTLLDVLVGSAWLVREIGRQRPALVHARSHVPALMALVARRATGVPFLFDCRGMFADAYVDFGHWNRRSFKYRLTKMAEPVLFGSAGHTVVLTERFKRMLLPQVRPERLTVIPCCVDLHRYQPRRVQQGDSSFTLCFAGSVANWYLLSQMLDFASVAAGIIPSFRLLMLNRNEQQLIRRELALRGLSTVSEVVGVSPAEVPSYLRRAHAGIAFLRPSFSMQAASPTKIGEYLAAGLPVVYNPGVGDLDELLAEVGVAVPRFDCESYAAAARRIRCLADHSGIVQACRRRAEQRLSLPAGAARYSEVYARLVRAS
jgi:glycosyltransferase involved in cell wall biosynthesis